jgi:ubiquinone/menaquinone biosynthesis C-methylase UbiE
MSDVSHLSSAASLGARREVAMLPRLLKAGEQVIDVCQGTADGRIAVAVVTDRRVLYMRRRRLWGADVESTPLARIRSAEERMGVRHSTVVIDAGSRVFELGDVDRALAEVFCARLRAALTRE